MDTGKVGKSPFVNNVLTVCFIIALLVLLVTTTARVFDVVTLLFGAVLVAVLLHGLATVLRRLVPVGEGVAVLFVLVLLIGISALGVWLLAPSIGEQINALRVSLPQAVQKMGVYVSGSSAGKALLEQLPGRSTLIETVKNSSLLKQVGGVFSSTINTLTNLVILLVVAIYLAIEPQTYIRGLIRLFPISSRGRVAEVMAKLGNTLWKWLIGKGVSMLFIGLTTWLGLSLLGVPLALTLGLIAGLLSFIPNFGPILSAVPALLLAFINSPTSALWVLVLFIGVQLIESYLLTPMIERKTVELSPVLTMVAQLALFTLLGAVGLLLATPILAVVVVLVQMLYVEDFLGDKAGTGDPFRSRPGCGRC